MSLKFRFVCATRESAEQFHLRSATGRSLKSYPFSFSELRLFPQNALGLPTVYNIAIRESAADPAVLIFIHDDVHLCDFFWPAHIIAGLSRFELVGVAGNTRRVPKQPAWSFLDDHFTWDSAPHLTGTVAHGTGFPPRSIQIYGPALRPVKLLDGVMLMAQSATLLQKQLLFDERFDFHFYDLDLCRQAELLGVSMGTCAISIIHESEGGFGSDRWREGYTRYLQKWHE